MRKAVAYLRSHLKSILSVVLFIALIALLVWYVTLPDNRADMEKLLHLSAPTIALLLALALGGCFMNCVYHRLILSVYDVKLSFLDWVGVVFVANAMAYVLPMRADLVFSAAYYKRVKGLQYTKSVSMAAGNIVFGMIFSLLQLLVSLLCVGLLDGKWPALLWGVCLIGMLGMGLIVAASLFFQDRMPAKLRQIKPLMSILTGFNALLKSRSLLWKLLLCLTINNIFQLLLYMACFAATGIPKTLYEALLYNSLSWMSSIVAIVPGNVGIKEAVLGTATLLMGASMNDGVAVSLLQRVAVMLVYVGVGGVLAFPVLRRMNREAVK